MSNFDTCLSALEAALQSATPATGPALDPDAYPGLKIERAPAAAADIDPLAAAAFAAAEWPEYDEPIPLVSELTDDQRALAEVLAEASGIAAHGFAVPQSQRARRLWLGLEEAGALGRDVDYALDGETRRAPLWRALWELDDEDDSEQAEELWSAIPLADRVVAYGELAFEGFRYEPPAEIDDPGNEMGEWAAAYADRLVALFAPDAPHIERGNNRQPPRGIRRLVLDALRGAGVEIAERWDALVPFDLDLIAALPPARRAGSVVRGLRDEFPMWACKKGLPAVARFPSAPVVEHLLERADQCIGSLSCPPRRQFLADIRAAVAEHPELVAMVDAHLDALAPLPLLTCTRKLYPTSADELTEGQKAQFAVLGKGWETDDGCMVWEEDGETRFGPMDFVSAYEIADADGNPAFEALLYMDEDGAVCRAGTTNSVAYVCQMGLEWNIDVETVEALHAILRERPPDRDS